MKATALMLCLIAALAGGVRAENQITYGLTVNGKTVTSQLLTAGGKHYVAVEDLAQSLSGELSYQTLSGGSYVIHLSLPTQQRAAMESPTTPPQSKGRVCGTVLYMADALSKRPDVGAEVLVVEPGV